MIPCSWIKASGYYLHILIEIGDPFSDFCCFQWYSPLISMFFSYLRLSIPFQDQVIFWMGPCSLWSFPARKFGLQPHQKLKPGSQSRVKWSNSEVKVTKDAFQIGWIPLRWMSHTGGMAMRKILMLRTTRGWVLSTRGFWPACYLYPSFLPTYSSQTGQAPATMIDSL